MKRLSFEFYLLTGILIVIAGFWFWERSQFQAELKALHAIEDELAQQSPAIPPQSTDTPDILIQFLTRDEGLRRTPYLDTKGNPTLGVGRNLKGNGVSIDELHTIVDSVDYKHLLKNTRVEDQRVHVSTLEIANRIFSKPLTDGDINLLLHDDIARVMTELSPIFPNWEQIDKLRQAVIVDMNFNLGLTTFKKFEQFIGAVQRRDWNAAATEMLKSLAAHEDVAWYHYNSLVMRTGRLP